MERSTSVPTGMGEQSLTPGEQRILALMEQGQQRLDQRLQSLEEGQKRMDKQLKDLTLKVDKEAAASKMRDQQLTMTLEHMRREEQERAVSLQRSTLSAVFLELNALRTTLVERLDQHNTRLEVIEQTLELNDAHILQNSKDIEGLQVDLRKLTQVEGLVQAQAPRMAPAP